MAAGIPVLEVAGRKDVQNSGGQISKNDHGFWLFSPIKVGKIRLFLLFS